MHCCFNSKTIEELTSENARLTEILKVKEDTEKKQAGTDCDKTDHVMYCTDKGQLGWHSGENTCLPPMWTGFSSWCVSYNYGLSSYTCMTQYIV